MSKVTGLAQTQLTPTDQITPEFGRGQRNARRVHRALAEQAHGAASVPLPYRC